MCLDRFIIAQDQCFENVIRGKMMFNFADREYDWLEFIQDKKGMFDYFKNK